MAKIDLRKIDNGELVGDTAPSRIGLTKEARTSNYQLKKDKKTVHGATEHSRSSKMITIAKKRADRRKAELAAKAELADEDAAEAGNF